MAASSSLPKRPNEHCERRHPNAAGRSLGVCPIAMTVRTDDVTLPSLEKQLLQRYGVASPTDAERLFRAVAMVKVHHVWRELPPTIRTWNRFQCVDDRLGPTNAMPVVIAAGLDAVGPHVDLSPLRHLLGPGVVVTPARRAQRPLLVSRASARRAGRLPDNNTSHSRSMRKRCDSQRRVPAKPATGMSHQLHRCSCRLVAFTS